ncbi:hypothetical protein PR202_ga16963 [Eleusine coracana subsp. coracana]|uniref:Uncharacterized protein n=1 Tax=Eleusine coracana subsp. coracana TaxID=191504 RepID=A0AAV5CPA0_ELECO|nr:hypothetical protein PR202_ga16963 [Eleusine coracana subsp. coracana]
MIRTETATTVEDSIGRASTPIAGTSNGSYARMKTRSSSLLAVRALDDQDEDTKTALMFAYESLPSLPVTPNAPLADAAAPAPDDDVDRISFLPD